MNQVTMESLLMTVGLELAAFFAIIGAFLLWRMKKGKNADRKAAQTLVENVKGNEKNRREGLLKVFGECYEMEEDELNAAVDEFLNRERAFYKTLISVYVDRDASEFSKMTGALEEMVKPYSDLALSAEVSVDTDELETLQEQNKNLEKELGESKQVMDELLSEYTATFDKKAKGKKPEAAQEEPIAEAPATDNDMEETLEIHVDNIPDSIDPALSITEEVEDENVAEVPVVETNEDTEETATVDEASELESIVSDDEVVSDLMIDEAESVSAETPEKGISLDEIDSELEAVEIIDAELIIDEVEALEVEVAAEKSADVTIDEVSLDEMDTGLEIIEETDSELIIDEEETVTSEVPAGEAVEAADNEVALDELNVELETVE